MNEKSPILEGTCSDSRYTDAQPCLTNGECSMNEYLDINTCLSNGGEWSHYTWTPNSTYFNEETSWKPISAFTGVFNGNGYVISNVYINSPVILELMQ